MPLRVRLASVRGMLAQAHPYRLWQAPVPRPRECGMMNRDVVRVTDNRDGMTLREHGPYGFSVIYSAGIQRLQLPDMQAVELLLALAERIVSTYHLEEE